jgi:hypothetical protein
VDREIAARERREAELAQAAATPAGETTDASTAELAARVREATARDDVNARGDAPTTELAAGRDEAAAGDREGRGDAAGGEPARADEDAITQGERRR